MAIQTTVMLERHLRDVARKAADRIGDEMVDAEHAD